MPSDNVGFDPELMERKNNNYAASWWRISIPEIQIPWNSEEIYI